MRNLCDKCGRIVSTDNDAGHIQRIANSFLYLPSETVRHFMRVVVDGKVVCEGSPSIAQYIDGQPHDNRAHARYDAARETEVRKAYDTLLSGENLVS